MTAQKSRLANWMIMLLSQLFGPATLGAAVISSDLRGRLDTLDPSETVPIVIVFEENVDLEEFRPERGSAESMIRALRDEAERSQARTLSLLGDSGYTGRLTRFWIINAAALDADASLVETLALVPEIARIDVDAPVRGPDVRPHEGNEVHDRDPEWNIARIRADAVWLAYGLDGTGIVLGIMDSGADIDHPALVGRWRGGDNSWHDLVNGLPDPYDDHGHGTHVTGLMVGGDGPGAFDPDIGVAYNAKFIAAKVLDADNSFSSVSIVLAGAQWMLDPDDDPATDDFPHIINCSWYFWSQGYAGFHGAVSAWRTAGIIPVFCIGNEGPGAYTTRSPGDYNNCIGVGGTDFNDDRYDWTSEGPSPVGWAFPEDRRKPDVSAPGEWVLSSVPDGGYEAWDGTSMATPHVAGTIALMLQAEPTLSYDAIKQILTGTAVDLGSPDYDYVFGYGRIDAYDAVTWAMTVAAPEVASSAIASCRVSPNPLGRPATIAYTLADAGPVRIAVYDVLGRHVMALLNDEQPAGPHTVTWDGRGRDGGRVEAGVYFVRLGFETRFRVSKVVVAN